MGTELHVQTILHGVVGSGVHAPVGHGYTVKLPVTFQYLVDQHVVGAAGLVVVEVIGTHYCPYLAFFHGSLEGGEVNLVQRTVAYHHIVVFAESLFIVQRKVLGTCGSTGTLDALDIGNYHARGEERVFAEVLEVAAADGRAIDIHAGAQHHILAAIAGFFAQAYAIVAGKCGIPCGGKTGKCGESHTRVIGLSGVAPLVPQCVGAYTMRAVVGPEVWNAQSGHACCRELALCMDDGYLFIEGHAAEHVIDALFHRFGFIKIGRKRLRSGVHSN